MFEIRTLTNPNELQDVAAFQASQPGLDIQFEPTALIALAQNGGLVLGAYQGAQLVGMSISILGTETRDPNRPAMANLKLATITVGIHPDHHHRDLAYRLFVRQREIAIQQGVRLITWTEDPMDSQFAHLSLRQLGAITDRYIPNYYGTNGFSEPGQWDRLIMEWWITRPRVEERLTGSRGQLALQHYLDANGVILSPAALSDAEMVQIESLLSSTTVLLEMPGQDGRARVRTLLLSAFAAGYVATDFVQDQARNYYVLSRVPTSVFSSN